MGSDLTICNQGTVAVEVVSSTRGDDILRGFDKHYWFIEGKTISPRQCRVLNNPNGDPTYIAFGLNDSKGVWGSGQIAQVPNLGLIQRTILSNKEKVLAGATKVMCARVGATHYVLDDDFTLNCAQFQLQGRALEFGQGPPLPLTSALYFYPDQHYCTEISQAACDPTHYYLNISPSATDRDLHATPGSKSGADGLTVEESDAANLNALKAILKAIADEGARKNREASDAKAAQERRMLAQPALREERQKQILAADAAGDRNVTVEAQMIRRDQETNRERWAGTRQSPAAFDPQWMGQSLVVVGTVSRVEVDPKGYPKWVTIYFKESPDSTFVVCSPYPEVFQERVGLNLNALIGKTIEAAGQVESAKCGPKTAKASVRVVESTQLKIR